MRALPLFLLLALLSSCGPSSCSGPIRSIPEIPSIKDSLNSVGAQIVAENIVFDWVFWCTWGGSACAVIGVLMLIWSSNKSAGIRLIITGATLNLTAKAMLWFESNEWVVWLVCVIGLILYCAFNPKWTEKVLSKLGIFVDLDGDGMAGTGKTAKKLGKKWFWIFRRKEKENDTK